MSFNLDKEMNIGSCNSRNAHQYLIQFFGRLYKLKFKNCHIAMSQPITSTI